MKISLFRARVSLSKYNCQPSFLPSPQLSLINSNNDWKIFVSIHISNTPSDSMGQSFLLPSSLSSICSKDRGLDLDSNYWLTILQGIWLISVLWLIQICFFCKAILSRKLFLNSLFVFKTTAFSLDFKAWESYAYVQIYFTIFW